jgi:hypothetical protein
MAIRSCFILKLLKPMSTTTDVALYYKPPDDTRGSMAGKARLDDATPFARPPPPVSNPHFSFFTKISEHMRPQPDIIIELLSPWEKNKAWPVPLV